MFSGIRISSRFSIFSNLLALGSWLLALALNVSGSAPDRLKASGKKLTTCFLLCCRSTHDFDNFFRDLCLSHAIHREGQRVDTFERLVHSGVEASHAIG